MASTTYRLGRDSWLVVPDETLEALKPDLTPPPPSQLQLAIERQVRRARAREAFSWHVTYMQLDWNRHEEAERELREERAKTGDE